MAQKFEVQYVSRYYDEKKYCSEIISAKSEVEALMFFANIFKIENYKSLFQPLFLWENGEWLSSFKSINKVKEVTCNQCNGTGIIYQIN